MKKKGIKLVINLFVILVALSVVLYFSLKDNFYEIVTTIFKMSSIYFIIAILLLVLYRLILSIVYYNVVKLNGEEISFFKCFQISFMVLFFNGITPFSGGGQPMEMYYLHKEGITVTKSTNIILQNFLISQMALVIIGILALLYNNIYSIFPKDNFIKNLVVLGFSINVLVLLVSFILSFSKKIQNFICKNGINLLARLNIIKDRDKVLFKLEEYLNNFHKNAVRLRKNKKVVLKLICLNMLGLIVFYSIPYVLARGMNINLTLLNTIVATTYVMIIGSFVPVPGGTGGIEYGFIYFYGYLVKGSLVNALMLVWRFVSYYLGMIFGSMALSLYRKKEK